MEYNFPFTKKEVLAKLKLKLDGHSFKEHFNLPILILKVRHQTLVYLVYSGACMQKQHLTTNEKTHVGLIRIPSNSQSF